MYSLVILITINAVLLQEEMKDGFLKSLPGRIEQMSNYLGERKFFAGDEVLLPGQFYSICGVREEQT